VIEDSGHWILEEQPRRAIALITFRNVFSCRRPFYSRRTARRIHQGKDGHGPIPSYDGGPPNEMCVMASKHLSAGQVTSLLPAGDRLVEERSAALFKGADLEVMRIVLRKDHSLSEHQVAGKITIQCLQGSIELFVQEGATRMDQGDFLHLRGGGERHSVRAIEHSSLLVTICLVAKVMAIKP